MRLHDLKPKAGSRTRRKRIGRGRGSGQGKTSGRGTKGQLSRAGSSVRPGFEGGQMPIYRRLPKRGFNNARFTTTYLPVNLKDLEEKFEVGARADEEAIRKAGLANGKCDGVKILGVGKLTKKLAVVASAFSASAKASIEAAGGSCELVSPPVEDEPKAKSKKPKADSPAKETPKAAPPAKETPKAEAPAEEAESSDEVSKASEPEGDAPKG
jgi:large subunit ribosomal protein L15